MQQNPLVSVNSDMDTEKMLIDRSKPKVKLLQLVVFYNWIDFGHQHLPLTKQSNLTTDLRCLFIRNLTM